jgi:hypothetical protein
MSSLSVSESERIATMSKTPFSSQVEILGLVWFHYKEQAEGQEAWHSFFEWADLGLPLAYLAWTDMCNIKPEGKRIILETWTTLCEILNVDPNNRYDSLEALFDASPNLPIDAEG